MSAEEQDLGWLLGELAPEVDAHAAAYGWSRAEAVRHLIGEGLRSEEELAEIRKDLQIRGVMGPDGWIIRPIPQSGE